MKIAAGAPKGSSVLAKAAVYGGIVRHSSFATALTKVFSVRKPTIALPHTVAYPQFGAYTLTEYFTEYWRGVTDSWNAMPAAIVAGAGVGIQSACMPSAVGASLGIMGLKFAIHGSGAELVHKTPAMTFYVSVGMGDGEENLAAPFASRHLP